MSKVAIYDGEGLLFAIVTPTFAQRAVANGTAVIDETGRYRVVANAVVAPAAQRAAMRAARWAAKRRSILDMVEGYDPVDQVPTAPAAAASICENDS